MKWGAIRMTMGFSQLKCKTSKKGLLLVDVIDFEFFGRKQSRNRVRTIQNQLMRSSAMFTSIGIYGSNIRNVAQYIQ